MMAAAKEKASKNKAAADTAEAATNTADSAADALQGANQQILEQFTRLWQDEMTRLTMGENGGLVTALAAWQKMMADFTGLSPVASFGGQTQNDTKTRQDQTGQDKAGPQLTAFPFGQFAGPRDQFAQRLDQLEKQHQDIIRRLDQLEGKLSKSGHKRP